MRLRRTGYGCRIGPHFVAAFGYADICILSLTPCGLRTIVSICEACANEYCIEFNGSKCEKLIFCRQPLPENMYPHVLVNNAGVPVKEYVVHLGNRIACDVSERHMDTIIAKFYKQYNLLLSRFGKIASFVKCQLFVTYCCSFYGVTLCDLKYIESVLVALRKCSRLIWNISTRTHSDILPHMTGPVFVDICWGSGLLNITTVPWN